MNVFLGLGLSWVAAVLIKPERDYYVPAGALGFSVVLFICCALLCVVILLIRRYTVGGELGGSNLGRILSCFALIALWMFYIFFSII